MEDIAQGVLAGVAIGGFTAVMVKVNMFAIDRPDRSTRSFEDEETAKRRR